LVKIPGEVDGGVEVFSQADLTRDRQRFWLIHGDSCNLPIDNHSIDLIVTDPPYYDSVQYSDLATFFRVWLAHLLPDEVEWTYDETHSAVATKETNGSSSFMTVLAGIFAECGRVLKQRTGRMVFTFHHWDPSAWAELTIALKSAGFRLMNAYVVYSEHPISVHIRNLNSIKHDSILVFALDGHRSPASWMPLEAIDTDDSETFCRQCSVTLGWLLESEFSPAEIRPIWKGLIQERG
jgi:adenine-specific DNA methylase